MTYLRNQPFDEKDFPSFADMREQIGFLPNFYVAQTSRPDLVDAESTLMGAILLKEGALPRRQKEYIFLTCSAANLSTYCVTAHCEIVRMLKLEGPEPEQIAIDYTHSKISMVDKVLLNFCTKLNKDRTKIKASDLDVLRTYGFSEQQIMEAIVIVGFSQFANTVAYGLGTVPDFHNPTIEALLGTGESRAEPADPGAAVIAQP